MDSLLVEVTGISSAIDKILSRNSAATSSTLFLLKSQIRGLETAVEDIRQWLHHTDPTQTAQVMRRLQDAIAIVKSAVMRLWYDLESIRQSLPEEGANHARNSGFSFDESRMRAHHCDMRECVSLMHFALGVCQSPADRIEERAGKELTLGTIMLFRAHATTQRERRMVILDHMPASRQQYSANFNAFMETILSAEEDLLQDFSTRTKPTQGHQQNLSSAVASWSIPGRRRLDSDSHSAEEDEDGRGTPTKPGTPTKASPSSKTASSPNPSTPTGDKRQSILTRTSSSSSLLTTGTMSTKVATTDDGYDETATLSSMIAERNDPFHLTGNQVPRKPVKITPRSPGSPSAITVAKPMSMSGIRQRDALMALAASSDSIPHRSRQEPRTSHLFREASGSLNSLTADVSSIRLGEEVESPPPYVHPPPGTPQVDDLKRRPTQLSNSSSGGYAEIFRAIRENNTDLLRNLLHNGGIVDDADRVTRRTPLMEAAVLRRNDAIQALLDAGARVHLKDSTGWTALHFAALQGDARGCLLLLGAGAQLDEYSANGETPLQLAARGGHTEAVVCLLNSWAVQRGNRQTLLRAFYEVSRCGNVSSAQAFVEKGVKPKHINETWSPISCAAESGSIPMLDYMISQGCSLKERSPDGWTPLHFAARYGHTSMVEKLLALKVPWKAQTRKTDETALHLAAVAGHTATAFALIMDKDASVAMRDADGQQALHHAVRNGDLSLSTTLLAHGARIDDMNSYGWQPIHLAAAYGHLTLVADFLTRGVGMEDKLGITSMRPSKHTNEAARRGFWAEIRWPHAGARPLHLALEFGHEEVANVLLAGGAKIEAADSHGWRALHYAAFNCRVNMVNHLMTRGASAQTLTDDNCTPLALGFRQPGRSPTTEEKEHVVELLQSGMDLRKKSKFKQLTTGFMTSNNTWSKTAEARNRIWHTAELAAALYQDYETRARNVDEGDSSFNLSEGSRPQTVVGDGQTAGEGEA